MTVPRTAIPSPDDVVSVGDPGDDTAARFVYQWNVAAFLACSLLDETLDVIEVYCEHHEDVLAKHSDGTFTGYQVKTRADHLELWKIEDDAVFGALLRFVRIDSLFPGLLRKFVLASNHPFLGTSLPALLIDAKDSSSSEADGKLHKLLTKLAKSSSVPIECCLKTLKKCSCDDSWPKMHHAKKVLADEIGRLWPAAANATPSQLAEVAAELVAECSRASSLDHLQTTPAYLSLHADAADESLKRTIDGKRIGRARLEGVLSRLGATNSLLVSSEHLHVPAGADTSILEQKLEAGGLSAVSINSATDLRDKADYKSLEWMSQFGEVEGLRRHSHIRSVVLADSADAHDTAKSQTNSEKFGAAMKQELRKRFRQRRISGGAASLFDCLDEHLEGHAYSLTNECKVWWSDPVPIKKRGNE